MKTIISFFTILISLTINAQQLTKQLKQIDSIVESKLKENHPGIAVGIVKDGKIIYEKYCGLSNLQHQVNFNKKTRSNIASTAKQFTALMVLDLSLEGKLSLDDDIRIYLPNLYKNIDDKIRIRHLINHTSGIRDYVELLDLEGNVWWQRFKLNNDDVMELLEKQDDLGFRPASKYSYSNSNYIVLTKIIEKVTGETFNDYSKQYFEGLGMYETAFVEKYMAVIPNRANPYSDWGSGKWWEVPTVTKTNGEGFLFTTLNDQLIYEQAVQNANRDNNQLLIQSQKPIPNSEIRTYGFGLELKDRLGRKSVYHSGGTYGFHSQTYRFPEEKLTVFIMSNNGNISSNLIAQEIAKILLPKIDKEDKYDANFYNRVSVLKEGKKSQIEGQYNFPNNEKLVRIVNENGKTYWKEGNYLNLEMVADGENTYSFANYPKIKVVFYDDKMVEYYTSGRTMIYERTMDSPASFSDIEGFLGTYYNGELEISFELMLSPEKELKLKLSNEEGTSDVQVFNKNYLLARDNYIIKIQRDAFDRGTSVLLTYGRAENIKFKKKTNLKFQPKVKTENGYIQVTTIGPKDGDTADILLTKNYPNGNEIWSKRLGGSSYDKASSIVSTKDGYLIVGSTSSYGKGNYDIYVIKTDKSGKQIWQNTYGKFYNDYGYAAEITANGYRIKGTTQDCPNNDDINRKCKTNVWFVEIDTEGNEISNKVLEKISHDM
ncbi:serine hydrolase [Winogradskyella sp.]|uniref:serine hydrolase domain-containing protein n=1 Tax=Winogradskyella sp. TaxID=1883156 RepID=UPI00261BE8C2|nr:serine hydrolase domain-containing protein [Winogradskyella sp.]